MSQIFCLIGKSASGKDTLYTQILMNTERRLVPIIPYTTRPKRMNERDGIDYHFITKTQMDYYESNHQIIEKREYHTVNGIWYYFTLNFEMCNNTDYILITTLEGVYSLINFFGEEVVQVIYLFLDDKVRLLRCIERESKQIAPNYNEVCRRFLADEEDFADSKLKKIKNIHYINTIYSLSECLAEWNRVYKQVKGRKNEIR